MIILGTTLVTCSFPFLFSPVFGGMYAADLTKAFYYTPFVIMFQIGWASVQISHLSLVADLTPNASERVSLNSYRYSSDCLHIHLCLSDFKILNNKNLFFIEMP